MKKTNIAFSLIGCLLFSTARAEIIEGIDVPAQKAVSGKALKLNGAGLRTVKLAMIPIKAYVAAFYAPEPLDSYDAVLASPGPLQFDFTFLRGVGQNQVTDAWLAQFRESCSYDYASLSQDRTAFIKMFGPLKKGGVETVVIEGDETRVFDGGALKGTIKGKDFQKAFLSLWFGSKPVLPSLKNELLAR